jgi:guanylate kinase
VLRSYTTRPPRYDGENGYIFVSPEEFKALGEIYAPAHFDGYDYGVTAELINKNDLFIVEPDGARFMREQYHGSKGVVVIGLIVEPKTSELRMKLRGDKPEAIERRLNNDKELFDCIYQLTDKRVCAEDSVDEIAEYLHEWISCVENDAPKHSFAIYDEQGRVVEDGKEFYSLKDSLWALKLAKETYPNGLPAGWEMRDETLALKARYVDLIKKCRPAFKRSGIEVDIDRSQRACDGYLYVPFTYYGKAHEYRSYHGEEWIEVIKPSLNAKIESAEKRKELRGVNVHQQKDDIDKNSVDKEVLTI